VTDATPIFLVDSNVLIDIRTEDPTWFDWSAGALAAAGDQGELAINPLIYAELSVDAERIEDLDRQLGTDYLRLPLPFEAGFLAGKAFVNYRRAGGKRRSPLPDFYIGAHAAVADLTLLTRDSTRYRSAFPTVALMCP
jgi:predicted nucleic acid-binding protein